MFWLVKDKIVFPGDSLAVQEEFVAGKNAFDSDDGKVYSDSAGKAFFDSKNHEVSVEKKRNVSSVKVGSVVFGKVAMIKTSVVVVEITDAIDEKGKPLVFSMSMASLPVRNASPSYLKSLSDAFKIGDLVKAKISMLSPYAIDVRTNDFDLGVIKAYCSKCRHQLQLFGRSLKCTNCGNTEERKASSEYVLK